MYDIKSGNPRDVNNSQEKKQAVKWMSFYQMKGATQVWLDETFSLDNGLTMMSNFSQDNGLTTFLNLPESYSRK